MISIEPTEYVSPISEFSGNHDSQYHYLEYAHQFSCLVLTHRICSSIHYSFSKKEGEIFDGTLILGHEVFINDLDFTSDDFLKNLVNEIIEFVSDNPDFYVTEIPDNEQVNFKRILKELYLDLLREDVDHDLALTKPLRECFFVTEKLHPLNPTVI